MSIPLRVINVSETARSGCPTDGSVPAAGSPIRNKYVGLRSRILIRLLLSGKLTPLKVWNALACYGNYYLRRPVSAKSPLLMNFELWNECNESCVFCRSDKNKVYDANPTGDGTPIPKGKLKFEHYKQALEQTADRLILAIL